MSEAGSSVLLPEAQLSCYSSWVPLTGQASQSIRGKEHVRHHKATCLGWVQYVTPLFYAVVLCECIVLDCLDSSGITCVESCTL